MRKNRSHVEISADTYANPFNAGAVVNQLDCVILGATEVDVDFNVNVNTESNGYLLHNDGGTQRHGGRRRLAIIVAPSIRGRLPIVKDEVTTITTPVRRSTWSSPSAASRSTTVIRTSGRSSSGERRR